MRWMEECNRSNEMKREAMREKKRIVGSHYLETCIRVTLLPKHIPDLVRAFKAYGSTSVYYLFKI